MIMGRGSQLVYACAEWQRVLRAPLQIFARLKKQISELSPFSLLRFLRKNAAKKEEVPGLGGKEEFRVQYPSGANRYPSTVTECRAVTSPRLHTTELWQEAVSEFICILFYTTKKKES